MNINIRINNSLLMILFIGSSCISCSPKENTSPDNNIKPYTQNPRYWQYQGKPVLLVGGTNDDNLFQMVELAQHLNELKEAGGNYIRNTMSSRDSGNVWPFYQQADGRYDLDRWGDEYWNRFESLLKLCHERDIIIQIEVWDRFDFSRRMGVDGAWDVNPYNPAKNINYSVGECGLEIEYPVHPSRDLQPFFHSIQGMPKYDPKLEVVKKYQEKFVDKILSYTLEYENVLYCMNNETTTPTEWGKYWMKFIRDRAKGKEIYTTDMFDRFMFPKSCDDCHEALKTPAEYRFLDVSQINSRYYNEAHWDTLMWIIREREKFPIRPVNCVKVYGGNHTTWGSGSNEDGIERFCRDAIGGVAAMRHHRPPTGNGLNDKSKGAIRSIRKIETLVNFWDVEPQMHLLTDREPNEAYLTCKQGEKYILYFPKGGSVKLDLNKHQKKFTARWISIETGEWGESFSLEGGNVRDISAPDMSGWYVVIMSS